MGLMDDWDILKDAGRAPAPAPDSGAGVLGQASFSTLGAVSAPRVRMVPVGSHFAGAQASRDVPGQVPRPAGSRFSDSEPEENVTSDRPAGTRFKPTPPPSSKPTGPETGLGDASPSPARPAGKRFASAAAGTPSAAGVAPVSGEAVAAIRPVGSRFAPAAVPGGGRISAPAGRPAEQGRETGPASASSPAPDARAGRGGASAAAVEYQRAVRRPVAVGGEPPHRGGGTRHPRRGDGRRRHGSRLSTVLIVLGVILLVVAGGIFVSAQLGYREAQDAYRELQQYAVSSDEGDGVPDVDFDALAAINPDIVGWLYIPGTVVNYPVVQTDDNTTYLTLLFDLSGNSSGTIFMDMDDTAPGMVDQQTTLYGHHMYDGSMLKVIDTTTEQANFDSIDTVYYITRDTTYTLTPMFTAQVEDTYIDARTPNFTGEGESLQAYLEDIYTYAKAEAPDARERIASSDKVMSLVTCAGEIIPRTTRAVMVLSVDAETARH